MGPSNPETPFIVDNKEWATAYLAIHRMSDNSRVYAYALWVIISVCVVLVGLSHWLGLRDSFVAAHWSRFALRRKTWRRWREQPVSLPSNGQWLALSAIVGTTLLLCFVGPDYIDPGAKLLGLSTREVQDPRLGYTINKAWWTAGGRTGIMAFALIPLAVMLALKAGPITLLTRIHFDKLSFLHRWVSMLVYFVTVLHVLCWSVQLSKDGRPGVPGDVAYSYLWDVDRFVLGWIAFGLFTMVVILSVGPLRSASYDVFYMIHILLVPLTLVFAGLHHPPMIAWTGIALGVWAVERLVRGGVWLRVNGILGGMSEARPGRHAPRVISPAMKLQSPIQERPHLGIPHGQSSSISPTMSAFPQNIMTQSHASPLSRSASSSSLPVRSAYIPPPGFAHAELLSGSTIRLTFISPKTVTWAPGQYFILGIPSVSLISTHPFTCASISDIQSPADTDRAMVFLIRMRTGWTKDLWDLVAGLIARRQSHAEGEDLPRGSDRPTHGVLLRMFVQGPFGSVERVRWGQYSTVVIIAGGSGVSFGIALLEYVCRCLSGRDGKQLGGSPGGWGTKGYATKRVRFVWLLREFAHIQWCAAALHRCMNLAGSDLQIDIFVTNSNPRRGIHTKREPGLLNPGLSRNASDASQESNISDDEQNPDVEVEKTDVLGGYLGRYGDEDENNDNEPLTAPRPNYIMDLTNWSGESDKHLPGEQRLSRMVQTVGRRSRAHSRRMSEFVNILPAEANVAHTPSPASMDPPLNPYARNGRRTVALTSPLSARPRLSVYPPTSSPWSPIVESDEITSPVSALSRNNSQMAPPLSRNNSAQPPLSRNNSSQPLISRNNSANNGNWDGRDAMGARSGLVSVEERLKLEVEEQEMRDINAVAVNAVTGKPKLPKILADEVARASGKVVVACCGPSSLSAMVRKEVANQIDTGRIWQGDMRGSITMVAEEFEY